MTNLELLVKTILEFFTRGAKNGQVTTGAGFVPLSTSYVRAKLVYISNVTGENLIVRQDSTDLILPDNSVFPLNNVSDLSTISVKTANGIVSTVTFRYEY